MNGKTSMVMTIDPQIREFLALIPREIIGFRLRTIKGHRVIIGEKIPLHAIANPSAMLEEVLPVGEK
jgi:hypothetical protein